jgi:NADH-quinone oxidoreductase subunit N
MLLYFTLGAFGVITLLSDKQNDADQLENYKGLFWKRPWVAIVFTLSLLSLAGIPLTTGFIAKFYVVFTGIHSGLWILVISLIINSVIGLYYYLRVITALFSPADDVLLPRISIAGHVVLAVVAVGIIWLGVNPEGFLSLIAHFSAL